MLPLLLLTLATSATAAAPPCNYSLSTRCLNPTITTSSYIPFPPLFPSSNPPTFTYALAELSPSDLSSLKTLNNYLLPQGYTGPVLKAAWWLEYDNRTVNHDRKQERRYYAFALESEQGCDKIVGNGCLGRVKEFVARKTMEISAMTDGGMGTVLSGLYGKEGVLEGCPGDLFGVRKGVNGDLPLLLDAMEPFAVYSQSFSRDPLASGGPGFTHGVPQLRLRSLAEQKRRGVVGVTVSWPWVNPLDPAASYKLSDVTVEATCVKFAN